MGSLPGNETTEPLPDQQNVCSFYRRRAADDSDFKHGRVDSDLSLVSLPPEVLHKLLSELSPLDLASLGETCRTLAAAAASPSHAEAFCRRRWCCPNELAFATSCDVSAMFPIWKRCAFKKGVEWKRLFCSANGWRRPRFRVESFFPSADFISSVSYSRRDSFHQHRGKTLLVASSNGIDVWSTQTRRQAKRIAQFGLKGTHESQTLYAVRQATGDALVAGSSDGALLVFRDNPEGPCCSMSSQGASAPIVDIQVLPGSGGAVAASLHDSSFAMQQPPGQRNVLQLWDIQAERSTAKLTDLLEGYELITVCSFGGSELDTGSPHELVAGSVQRDFCFTCYALGLPSLCHHKSPSQAAAACIFDMRDSASMVQRFHLSHRSLYPVMATTRGNFLLTSHAGTPLSVWDRRNMVSPIYEEPHLLHKPPPALLPRGVAAHRAASLWADPADAPFPLPEKGADHQGLFLAATDDCVVGRAENGMMWVWDLAASLGWARGRSDAELLGPWQTGWGWHDADAASMDRASRPYPLGALCCDTSLPFVDVAVLGAGAGGGARPTTQLSCLSSKMGSDSGDSDSAAGSDGTVEYIVCATLADCPVRGAACDDEDRLQS